jgi:predicted DNA-binding transcriptional regulator AlpA
MPDCYSSADVAKMLGLSMSQFYRQRPQLHAIDKMPDPMSSIGHPRWHKATMDAWLGRHHHLMPRSTSNDATPAIVPMTIEQQRARLAAVYKRSA